MWEMSYCYHQGIYEDSALKIFVFILIRFQGKAKWFCWQNLIVLRTIEWPGPEKAGGIQSIDGWRCTATPWHRLCYPWHQCHPLLMEDWWWIAGHCVGPTIYTESHCTALQINSNQFYIYSTGNFGLGIRFVFPQILALLFRNVLFCARMQLISRWWPPTIASGIFPIWVEAAPLPPLPLTSLHISSFLSLESAARDISTFPPLTPFHFLESDNSIFSTLSSPFPQQRGIERKTNLSFLAKRQWVPNKTLGAVLKQFKLLTNDRLDRFLHFAVY